MASVDKRSLRLLDANANRCREGLRVVEDTARFILCAAPLARRLRELRHAVDRATRSAYPALLAQRDADGDHGRTVPEGRRPGIRAIVAANFRRVEESLRVLEEYGKLVAPQAAARFKKVRYAAYTLEKEMVLKFDDAH